MGNTEEDVKDGGKGEQQPVAELEVQPRTPPNGQQILEAAAPEDADASKATPTVGLFDHRYALAPQLKTPRETGIFDPPSPSPSESTPSESEYDDETDSTPLDSVQDQDSFGKPSFEGSSFRDQLQSESSAHQNGSLGVTDSVSVYGSDMSHENGTQINYPSLNGDYTETLPIAPRPPIYTRPLEWMNNSQGNVPTNGKSAPSGDALCASYLTLRKGFGQDAPQPLSNNIPARIPSRQSRQSIRGNRNNRPSTVKGFPGPDGIFVYESGIPSPCE
jgi:hypothetical protein